MSASARLILYVLSAGIFLMTHMSQAEVIYLMNGQKLKGEVVTTDERSETVTIVTRIGEKGVIEQDIKWAEIMAIVSDETAPEVERYLRRGVALLNRNDVKGSSVEFAGAIKLENRLAPYVKKLLNDNYLERKRALEKSFTVGGSEEFLARELISRGEAMIRAGEIKKNFGASAFSSSVEGLGSTFGESGDQDIAYGEELKKRGEEIMARLHPPPPPVVEEEEEPEKVREKKKEKKKLPTRLVMIVGGTGVLILALILNSRQKKKS